MAPLTSLVIPRKACMLCFGQVARQRSYFTTAVLHSEQSRLPRVASPSFWSSLVPRFLRRPVDSEEATRRAEIRDAATEERRTGLIFLFLGILVGSNAINIISIRREMLNFSRQTDAKLELLREVVQKVKNGEDVDVKKALGTGNPDQEKEWEQVMKELEDTDMLWEGRKKRDAKRARRAEVRKAKNEEPEQPSEKPVEDTSSEPQKSSSPKFFM